MFRGEKPSETRLAPMWSLEEMAHHAVDFWLSTEDLPRPDNRVTLAATAASSSVPPNNEVPKQRLYDTLKSMLGNWACTSHLIPRIAYMKNEIPSPAGAPGGHVPLRPRPGDSVLDANCKAHEVDNLYVVDTSFFPSIGAVNPALTAMANALRVGDHLLERMAA